MNVANMAIVVAVMLTYILYLTRTVQEGFRSTKCFSCEAQDSSNGRGYGSKCFSCEAESSLPHPNKCFSCENDLIN